MSRTLHSAHMACRPMTTSRVVNIPPQIVPCSQQRTKLTAIPLSYCMECSGERTDVRIRLIHDLHRKVLFRQWLHHRPSIAATFSAERRSALEMPLLCKKRLLNLIDRLWHNRPELTACITDASSLTNVPVLAYSLRTQILNSCEVGLPLQGWEPHRSRAVGQTTKCSRPCLREQLQKLKTWERGSDSDG
jgi:hypothetical protein